MVQDKERISELELRTEKLEETVDRLVSHVVALEKLLRRIEEKVFQ